MLRFLLLLCTAAAAVAQAPPPAAPVATAQIATAQIKDIRIPRLTSRPKIEDFLNGQERLDMRRVEDFRQRNPGDGLVASRKTVAYFGYDDKNLYAAFVCEAKPGELRARIAKREDVFSDDIVGIFLDTYHDRQRAYEFFVNPLGVQGDAVTPEDHAVALYEAAGADVQLDVFPGRPHEVSAPEIEVAQRIIRAVR